MKELVEKLAYQLACHRFTSHQIAIAQVDRDFAGEAIRIIGKAYANGELELPGEEARIKDCYVGELGGYRDIIALRKEEDRDEKK